MENGAKIKLRCIYFILALLAACAACTMYSCGLGNVLVVGICMGVYFLYCSMEERLTKRRIFCAIPGALLYGMFLSIGTEINRNDDIVWSMPEIGKLIFWIAGIGSIAFPVLILVLAGCDRDQQSSQNESPLAVLFAPKPRTFFLAWGAFFVSFVPALLAYFPGIFSYDFPTQINQIAENAVTTHHPILHSLLCYFFLNIGRVGSDCTVGAACYAIFQMICLSGCFAYSIFFMAKKRLRGTWIGIAVIFYLLLPIHALFSINATKDIIFAGLFLLLFLFTLDAACDPEAFFHSPFLLIRYAFTMALMCLLRNTGIYLMAALLLLSVILVRKYRGRVLCFGLCCILAFFACNNGLIYATGAESGSKIEALALPVQQIARSYLEEPEKFSEEDRTALFALIPEENVERYSSRLADVVKNNIDWDSDDAAAFLKLWIKKMPSCLGSYLKAFFSLTNGFWYPDLEYPDVRTYHEYIETGIKDIDENTVITRTELLPAAYQYYEGIASGERINNLPGLSLLFKPGIYAWILLGLAIIAAYKRQKKYRIPLCMMGLFWAILLLSPIALLRYAYPMMIAIPVLIGIILTPDQMPDRNSA